jgi:transposase-like protein
MKTPVRWPCARSAGPIDSFALAARSGAATDCARGGSSNAAPVAIRPRSRRGPSSTRPGCRCAHGSWPSSIWADTRRASLRSSFSRLGSYQTAWTLLHKLRSALGHRPQFRLTGLVEVDEAYVGGAVSGGARGRGAPHKALVAGAVEQREHSAGSVRLAVVTQASRDELGPFVRGVIDAAQATVLTDGWRGYQRLGEMGVDHRADVQGHSARATEILPWIHKVFSNLKTWLRGTFHGVSPKHLPRYLQEFSYRFDRCARESELFFFVLRRAVHGEPLPYARLTAEVTG